LISAQVNAESAEKNFMKKNKRNGSIIGALLGLVTVLVVWAISTLFTSYDQRIEEKYNIDVVAVRGKYGDGDVIFYSSSGQLCSAAQGPNDILISKGCGELAR
jgi:hypothetical protein